MSSELDRGGRGHRCRQRRLQTEGVNVKTEKEEEIQDRRGEMVMRGSGSGRESPGSRPSLVPAFLGTSLDLSVPICEMGAQALLSLPPLLVK